QVDEAVPREGPKAKKRHQAQQQADDDENPVSQSVRWVGGGGRAGLLAELGDLALQGLGVGGNPPGNIKKFDRARKAPRILLEARQVENDFLEFLIVGLFFNGFLNGPLA